MSAPEPRIPILNTIGGISIDGLPSAILNTLQYDAINNKFIWVAGAGSGGAGTGMKLTINQRGDSPSNTGEITIEGKNNSRLVQIINEVLGINPIKSISEMETGIAIQGGAESTMIILSITCATNPITNLKIWASDTLDTADGVMLTEIVTTIPTGSPFSTVSKIPTGKFITVEAICIGNVETFEDECVGLELGA